MGLSNGGLRPLSAICVQSSTIVHFVGHLRPFLRGTFVAKMTAIVGNRGQLWTSTLSPHLPSPHLDFLIIGSSQTWLFQTWSFAIFTWKRSFALFCALLRSFCSLSRSCVCSLLRSCVCSLLRSFARICVFLRPIAFRSSAFGNCRDKMKLLRT